MTRTVLKMFHHGEWKVTFDDAEEINPYRVYSIQNRHRKQLERYGDMESCLHHIAQCITGHEWMYKLHRGI